MKNIIFCADGTWNGPQDKTNASVFDDIDNNGELAENKITNVVKLFSNLEGGVTTETRMLHNEQEKVFYDKNGKLLQVSKYIHGVGDSTNPLIKYLGGGLGMGIIKRIIRGYTFISRYYEPGDQIYIIGFSRGAYTARALAAMIAKVGLLNRKTYNPNNKLDAYRLGLAAWSKSKSVALHDVGLLSDIASGVINFVQGFFAKTLPDNGLIPDVPIKGVAVWDTVGALGIPQYAGDSRYDLFKFVDTKLSDKIEFGFHGMAIDEFRGDFAVTRWDTRHNIDQVWFVGAHSDVGGGYSNDECHLSDQALGWMMKKLSNIGVTFIAPLIHQFSCQPNLSQPIHRPWEKFPFSSLPSAARLVEANDVLHSSVLWRWGNDLAYRPEAMKGFASIGLGQFKIDETIYP